MTFLKNLLSLASIETLFFIFIEVAGLKGPKFKLGDTVCFDTKKKKIRGIITDRPSALGHIYIYPEIATETAYYAYRISSYQYHKTFSAYELNLRRSSCLLCEKCIR